MDIPIEFFVYADVCDEEEEDGTANEMRDFAIALYELGYNNIIFHAIGDYSESSFSGDALRGRSFCDDLPEDMNVHELLCRYGRGDVEGGEWVAIADREGDNFHIVGGDVYHDSCVSYLADKRRYMDLYCSLSSVMGDLGYTYGDMYRIISKSKPSYDYICDSDETNLELEQILEYVRGGNLYIAPSRDFRIEAKRHVSNLRRDPDMLCYFHNGERVSLEEALQNPIECISLRDLTTCNITTLSCDINEQHIEIIIGVAHGEDEVARIYRDFLSSEEFFRATIFLRDIAGPMMVYLMDEGLLGRHAHAVNFGRALAKAGDKEIEVELESTGTGVSRDGILTIGQIISQNACMNEIMPVRTIYDCDQIQPVSINERVAPRDTVKELYACRGYKILSPHLVIAAIFEEINKEMIRFCDICCSRSHTNVLPCGGNCRGNICAPCAREWYTVPLGEAVDPTKILCPLCRNIPREGCRALRFSPLRSFISTRMDPNMIYGLCKGCRCVKPVEERGGCGGEGGENVRGFVCNDCKDIGEDLMRCPGCGIATELREACNHIECLCGTHWCFKCGGEFDPEDIYEHMDREHGGYYN